MLSFMWSSEKMLFEKVTMWSSLNVTWDFIVGMPFELYECTSYLGPEVTRPILYVLGAILVRRKKLLRRALGTKLGRATSQ